MNPIESLLAYVKPLAPSLTINEVGELMLTEDYRRFLSLPVVDEDKPVGCISRARLQNIFMHMYGRDLHGRKRLAEVMNPVPLVVGVEQSMEEAARYITDHIDSPITEDFILTRSGCYAGIGSVVDMLRAMEAQIADRNRQIASAYQQLKASQAHLVQSEKMASLGQMVAGVAHEINTPLGYVKNNVVMARDLYQNLTGVLGAYDQLITTFSAPNIDSARAEAQLTALAELRADFESTYPEEETRGLFDDTIYGIKQISEIVVNLKDFSRLDQAAHDLIDLNACVDSALVIAKNVYKQKAEITRDFGELPKVRCAPSQINQVFLNLITNAAHAIEGFGRIDIKTTVGGGYVHVLIGDNGRGIPAENLKKIFDPFFTTKPVGEGTGLGLAISYKIIRDHHGAIRVMSTPGVGTRFCVSLPIERKLH